MAHSEAAEHALDFARRYAEPMDYLAAQRMLDLGLPPSRIGMPDHVHGIAHAAFHAHFANAGGVSPDGRIVIEGGLLDPTLMDELGPSASGMWSRARLRDRLDAAIAHEYEEHRGGMDHDFAVSHAPETALPIGDGARELLRRLDEAWRSR